MKEIGEEIKERGNRKERKRIIEIGEEIKGRGNRKERRKGG